MNTQKILNQNTQFSFYKTLLMLLFWAAIFVNGTAQEASINNEASTAYSKTSAIAKTAKKETVRENLSTARISRSPFFASGNEALQSYFDAAIKYTENAKENCKEGIVKVQVLVSPNGQLKDPRILDPIDKELEAQIVKAIQALPNWEPALQNGMPVKCKMIIPIKFRLH